MDMTNRMHSAGSRWTSASGPAVRPVARAAVSAAVALLATAMLMALAPAEPAQAQTNGHVEPARSAVGPGDVLRIAVWRRPELTGEFAIAADGTVVHPLYREVVVAGVPIEEAERRLRELLSRYESNPQFVIEPLIRVAVGGEVRVPNLYTLPRETTIVQALAAAGGPTDRGRPDRVRLIRDGIEQRMDVTDPQAGIARASIRSGDQIHVERRGTPFREVITPVASVAAAIAAAVSIFAK